MQAPNQGLGINWLGPNLKIHFLPTFLSNPFLVLADSMNRDNAVKIGLMDSG
jgi:hypothetical protein